MNDSADRSERAASPGEAAAASGWAEGPPTGDPATIVRAAGGVVWRRAGDDLEVVLVHRPRYDDWSLPKGKVDPDETEEEAAVREVEEEASIVGLLGPELTGTTYIDRSGRTKTVRYWSMTTEDRPAASHEVDDAAWLPFAEARRRLSYERDVEVLDSLLPVISSDVGGE